MLKKYKLIANERFSTRHKLVSIYFFILLIISTWYLLYSETGGLGMIWGCFSLALFHQCGLIVCRLEMHWIMYKAGKLFNAELRLHYRALKYFYSVTKIYQS